MTPDQPQFGHTPAGEVDQPDAPPSLQSSEDNPDGTFQVPVVSPDRWGAPVIVEDRAEAMTAGADAATGRFAWHHPDCGSIYADTLDDAVEHAYTRLHAIDPATASTKCVQVVRAGYNPTPGDWETSDSPKAAV